MTGLSASPSSVSSLAPGEVHLWLCTPEQAATLDLSVLSADERARGERWRGDGISNSLLGRALLRQVLSRYAEEPPEAWLFEAGPNGKPAAIGASRPLEFNLSHSEAWLALAVSEAMPVGVDVQWMDPDRPVERLARRYFTAGEVADMDSLDTAGFQRHFYRLWALKEAWTKSRGDALPTALGRVGFRLADGRLESLNPGYTAGEGLWLMEFDDYSLCLCCHGGSPRLRCFQGNGVAVAEVVQPPLLAAAGVAAAAFPEAP